METPSHGPDFFELLGLSPDAPWSDASFEAALQTRQQEWSRQTNHPTRGLEAQKNLSQLSEIRRVLGDPVTRATAIEQAGAQRGAAQAQVRAELQAMLRLVEGKGYLLQAEVDRLVERFC